MDKHTYLNKRKIGSTDICDFTDYQGIGRDPLYKRYDSVNSIVRRVIDPQYAHFLAVPYYSTDSDTISWYIDEWNETPERYVELEAGQKERYAALKKVTVAHYKASLDKLSGEDLQVMVSVLRYINDEFIYCCDGKVYLLAWGMTPDPHKHVSPGELVHESSNTQKRRITFDPGVHGRLVSPIDRVLTVSEDRIIQAKDLPLIEADPSYVHVGWEPNPVGMKLTSDLTVTATYEARSEEPNAIVPDPEPAPVPKPETEPEPQLATVTFDAGEYGMLQGSGVIRKTIGSKLYANDIPGITPLKGYRFSGWSINPMNLFVNGDTTIRAVYEKKHTWYRRWWLWLTGSGCLKWLLWILLVLLLLLLLFWLLRGCNPEERGVGSVDDIERIVDEKGDSIDYNGPVTPISLEDGQLPDNPGIVAPVRGEEGELPPIVREPGVPPTIANRLFLFLEDENDTVDAFAEDFKKAYPDDRYNIIGFDREVKSLLIEVPEAERDEIRNTINDRIPNHRFLILDEQICELKGQASFAQKLDHGWHLKAVNAEKGWQITTGSREIRVAVVDDGIDASHPMFKGRITEAYNVFTQNNRLSKGEGHGTHVAGLAVGSLDYVEEGAAGIAPECLLIPIQVFDNGMCPLSALVSGIMYAVHKDADVVNISVGPSFAGLNQLPVEVQDQIAQNQFKNVEKLWTRVCQIAAAKNTILIFSAGNDDILSSIPPENRTSVAITVGAVDQNLYPTDFTNYGPCTDISAPGKEIYSSFPIGSFMCCDGTSMAAPIVTGTIALMKTLKKDLTVTQALNVLYRTGADVYGYMPPMVQVDLALDAVKRGDFSQPEPRPMRPVPVTEMPGNESFTPPSSWSEPAPGTDIGILLPVAPENGGSEPDPSSGITPAIPDNPTDSGTDPANPEISPSNPEKDYESIRRLIEIYKQKIAELEGQLPENQR